MADAAWPESTLLGRLDESARTHLLSLGVRRSAAPYSTLLREGAREQHVIVLDDAVTKVTASMGDGRQALLAIRMSGDVIGEISALNATPRSATVTTCCRSTIRIVHRRDFRAFLRANPEAAIQVAGMVADKLRWSNRRRVDFAAYPARVRLARVLCEFGLTYGRRRPEGLVVDIRLTQAELATLCGAAEVTVQKHLHQLRSEGIIGTGYRRVVILDIWALRQAALVDEETALPS